MTTVVRVFNTALGKCIMRSEGVTIGGNVAATKSTKHVTLARQTAKTEVQQASHTHTHPHPNTHSMT